jgi:hypothetical protein
MSAFQTQNMTTDDLAWRLEWLASAGIRLAIDNCDALSDHGLNGIQALFETIEGTAAELYERLEIQKRDGRAAA